MSGRPWSPRTLREVAAGHATDEAAFELLLAVAEGRRSDRRLLNLLLELATSEELLAPLVEALARGSAVRPGDGESPWAMVPRSVALQLRCDDCLRLWVLVDQQGHVPEVPRYRGLSRLEADLGWQRRNLKRHVGHLVAAGILAVDPAVPGPGEGWSEVLFRLLHNPARAAEGLPMTVEGVWESGPPTRYRSPGRWSPDAVRGAPSVCKSDLAPPRGRLTDARRGAPSVREAPAECARRATSVSATRHAIERGAPSVPASPSASEVWGDGAPAFDGLEQDEEAHDLTFAELDELAERIPEVPTLAGEADALARVVAIFPGTEVAPAGPRCAGCATPVVPSPAAVEHGWATLCPDCAVPPPPSPLEVPA